MNWGRRAGATLALGLVAFIVVTLATNEPSAGDRVEALAGRLRCPVCQSEAVADSTSQTARDMRDLIEQQVAEGRSNDEIEQFFVARYGEWILLDAPPRGRTLLLWVLPALALVGGAVAIITRVRRRPRARESAATTVEDRRGAIRRDLAEVAAQVELGEIDDAEAARLQQVYEAELAAVEEEDVTRTRRETRPRSPARVAAGVVVVVAAGVAVVLAVASATEPRPPGGFATGGIAGEVVSGGDVDLDSVTNEELEEVVAQNPDIIPMRLALARRYFAAGEFSSALPHYMAVLEQELNPEALANVGWMAFLSDETEIAAGYLERSLDADPDFVQAKWFLANVRLYGQDDAAAAAPLIEEVLASEGVPEDIRTEAERMLAEATASSS